MKKIIKPSITRMKLIQELEREFGWKGLKDDRKIQSLLMDTLKAIDMINSRKRNVNGKPK